MNARDFRHGDVVTYMHTPFVLNALDDGDLEDVPVVCRLLGKLARSSVGAMSLSTARDVYVLVPVDKEDAPKDLRFLRDLRADGELEWGGLGQHKYDECVCAYHTEISPTFGPDEIKVLKEEGRCPRCGELGPFIGFQATCSYHGVY